MVVKKDEPAVKQDAAPAAGTGIVQRYRFRVRTSDGRELVSHIATVTRPAPPVAAQAVASPFAEPQALKAAPFAEKVPLQAASELEPLARQPEKTAMQDVPVHLILVAVKGQKQGVLHTDPGFKDLPGKARQHQFSIQEFSYAVASPRDPKSGLPTGQRMHKPVIFGKELGPSTPQLYAALANNETLPEVTFDCYGPARAGGQMVLAHSIKLTNASVASIGFRQLNVRNPALMKFPESALISLTFEKIEWTHDALVAEDSWVAND